MNPPFPDAVGALDVRGAIDLRSKLYTNGRRRPRELDTIGLAGFLKTTGGKGLHVVVPLEGRHSWNEVKASARAIAEHLAQAMPDRFTASLAKQRRTGRIFVDYWRNGEVASAVAAYSARARPGAPVSTAIGWDELADDVRGSYFNVRNVPDRLTRAGKDPSAAYAQTAQRISREMRRALGGPAVSG
jgi:bifunctional non-homologous end joining protein LigD